MITLQGIKKYALSILVYLGLLTFILAILSVLLNSSTLASLAGITGIADFLLVFVFGILSAVSEYENDDCF